MNGADYVITDASPSGLHQGVEYDEAGNCTRMECVGKPGERAHRVNPDSLPWLLEQGYIAHDPPADAEQAKPARKRVKE